ncbi:hypothetical protein CL630_02435 [bacterium]|nr:hypothetical protein [bacterium]|tara:strand:- start:47504 stop:48967 length:1464 start_codon:yes stop_codon:yes gene_type:complete
MKSFFTFLILAFFLPLSVSAQVVVNEIAWMGTSVSASDEWIELKNTSNEAVDITGWTLKSSDDTPTINLEGAIAPQDFFLLERTNDDSVLGILADLIYVGALSNSGEFLTIYDSSQNVIDSISASDGWQAGDNTTKETMQRTSSGEWITATGTPKATNAGADSSNEPEEDDDEEETPTNSSETSTYVPTPIQTITVDAGSAKRTTVVGADIIFKGTTFGLKGEPIENTRFVWSFGDGSMREGGTVAHAYRYAGEYVVILEGASGNYSASDRIDVEVIPADIFITDVGSTDDFFISLVNKTAHEINLESWILRAGVENFRIPHNTFIPSSKTVQFAQDITGLTEHDDIALLYPSGKIADIYQKQTQPDELAQAPVQIITEQQRQEQTVTSPIYKPEIIEQEIETQQNTHEDTQIAALAHTDNANGPITASNNTFSIFKWALALIGLLGISLGTLFLMRTGQPALSVRTGTEKNLADQFEIIEEKSKDN